ncbi:MULTISPECIES: tripartite tricarboxylate transporter substrate binding protein [Ramlibacter]|uniref:Tripartite tricarboxylate transporter substrate binding protein n=1 Tax=Ramlibacter pinisoli TaxID=2682844 RepID=A0A6N8IXH8_9BURK|nr:MULTISPECIES: tripartite tricarboxylate transporter substrate-binding protein [Ramlibacter]MBA2961535.1 tripartite tricarboxylate transporter substrate binding protein [Ramlibacter sp. CGMCC 1.13660]MVQ31478.1 tripartite tricarboxylate transporter substrate binding protein [Ramlibacter pinisoli]
MPQPLATLAKVAAAALAAAAVLPAIAADWKPTRPVEFIVTSGPGGGTDQFARVVQSVVQKHKLMPVPVVVSNKSGGAGTEGLVAAKGSKGDPHKLVFSTNLAYLMPMITRVGYSIDDVTPVAIMAADEFILWSYAEGPYKTAKDLIAAAKAKNGSFKMGGAQSKDTDHILTRQVEKATGVNVTYVPFKSGGEVAVQLAGGHVEANTNNPSENISHWRAGKVRPLCVFAKQRLPMKDKVAGDMSWNDIPTCKEQGIAVDEFRMPRTVWAMGDITPEQSEYFRKVMAQVREKPEFKEWLQKGLQTDMFLTGTELARYIANDKANHKVQFSQDGWLLKD